MSSFNNLSTAANVAQIIGFAGTVFQTGKAVYELFDKARSASRNISLLLLELQALLNVVAFVHVVIAEHATSPFAREDQQTLPNIHTILMLIDRDFLHLKGIIGQSANCQSASWFSSFQSSFRWAWNDHEVVAARERLARYTQNLGAALSVTGRRNDIVLRTKVQDIEAKLQVIAQMNPMHISVPAANALAPASKSRTLVPVRPSPLRIKLASKSSQKPGFTHAKRSSVRDISIHSGTVVPATNKPIPETLPYSEDISDKTAPKINIYGIADNEFVLDTGIYALCDFTKSAIMLQDPLSAALDTICVKNNKNNSTIITLTGQLRMLFELVITSTLTASAKDMVEKYSLCSDMDSTSLMHSKKAIIIRRKSHSSTVEELDRTRAISDTDGSTFLDRHTARLTTNVGTLEIDVLFARSITVNNMLCFHFRYHGNSHLGLTAFCGDFTSYAITKYAMRMSCILYTGETELTWRLRNWPEAYNYVFYPNLFTSIPTMVLKIVTRFYMLLCVTGTAIFKSRILLPSVAVKDWVTLDTYSLSHEEDGSEEDDEAWMERSLAPQNAMKFQEAVSSSRQFQTLSLMIHSYVKCSSEVEGLRLRSIENDLRALWMQWNG